MENLLAHLGRMVSHFERNLHACGDIALFWADGKHRLKFPGIPFEPFPRQETRKIVCYYPIGVLSAAEKRDCVWFSGGRFIPSCPSWDLGEGRLPGKAGVWDQGQVIPGCTLFALPRG